MRKNSTGDKVKIIRLTRFSFNEISLTHYSNRNQGGGVY